MDKNAMNKARGMKKVEHALVQPKHIDIYLDAEARDDDPERSDLKRDETNVRPETKYYKSLDPLKLGGIKVTPKPNVLADLTPGTGPMQVELQKHHLQRAAYRLTEAKKKQSFEKLLHSYFHVDQLDVAKDQLNQLLNTPVRPLSEPEMNNIEAQLKSHDARLLNDTNAIMHIIFDSRLLTATREALTGDQWSGLLKYALLSLYQRTAQVPPSWLGPPPTKDQSGVADETRAQDSGTMMRESDGSIRKDPAKTAKHQEEGANRNKQGVGRPKGKLGFNRYYGDILQAVSTHSDNVLIDEAQQILAHRSNLPEAVVAWIISHAVYNSTSPEIIDANIAAGMLHDMFNDIYTQNRPTGYTKDMREKLNKAFDFFFREKKTPP